MKQSANELAGWQLHHFGSQVTAPAAETDSQSSRLVDLSQPGLTLPLCGQSTGGVGGRWFWMAWRAAQTLTGSKG